MSEQIEQDSRKILYFWKIGQIDNAVRQFQAYSPVQGEQLTFQLQNLAKQGLDGIRDYLTHAVQYPKLFIEKLMTPAYERIARIPVGNGLYLILLGIGEDLYPYYMLSSDVSKMIDIKYASKSGQWNNDPESTLNSYSTKLLTTAKRPLSWSRTVPAFRYPSARLLHT